MWLCGGFSRSLCAVVWVVVFSWLCGSFCGSVGVFGCGQGVVFGGVGCDSVVLSLVVWSWCVFGAWSWCVSVFGAVLCCGVVFKGH